MVQPKPPIPLEAVTDSNVAAKYDSELEAWGEAGWATVARLCRWAAVHGSEVKCPD